MCGGSTATKADEEDEKMQELNEQKKFRTDATERRAWVAPALTQLLSVSQTEFFPATGADMGPGGSSAS